MAEKVTIARPYAKAAFEFAREHGVLARWSDFLANASAVVTDDRVAKLLLSPRVMPADLVGVIAGVCGSSSGESLDVPMSNFLETLAHNRRLGLLPHVAAIFETLRADVENIADVQVASAMALDDAQRARLRDALAKRLKREIRLHVDVDPSLIGGAVVRCGDFVIDGSLKARLQRLATELTH
jgi:F-type H+-transporting ATPase subunit delta